MQSTSMEMLDEHQPRDTGNAGPATYEPTPEEKKTIKMVERQFEKARKYRSMYDEKWLDYYRMFRGKQWKEQRPSYRHSEVVNLIFRTIQSLVPIQADARPRFEFLPQEPSDYELSQILNEVAEADWITNNWGERLLEVIYDSNIYGTGLSKMVWDQKDDFGAGKTCFESIDPIYCYPDPDARDVNDKCDFFVYAEPVEVKKLKREYPDKAEFIKADILDLSKGAKADMGPVKFRSPVDNKVVMEGSTPTDLVDKDRVLKIICWMTAEACADDFDEKEQSEQDPETGEVKTSYVQVAKYPKGRKIVLANGVLLEDSPNGYEDGKIPYHRYPNYILPREFWGMSEVEQLEGPQRTFNKLVNFALDVMTLMGNPIWKVHGASGVDPENLLNRPGLVVEWDGDPAHEPKREEGVGLQPYVLQMIDKMGEWFDSIAGAQDVTRGVQPTGVTAASAINTLQEAAQTRVRQKARNLDFYLQNVGQQYISRVFQFYTAPRVFRLTGEEGASKYFRMHVEQTPEGTTKAYVQPYLENGQYNPLDAQEYETRGRFDVRVVTGSSLPFAKAEKQQQLQTLFQLGIIDEEEVLKGSDYPNWEAVMMRMQQKKMMMAQQEAAQAAGVSPPQGAPAAPPPAA